MDELKVFVRGEIEFISFALRRKGKLWSEGSSWNCALLQFTLALMFVPGVLILVLGFTIAEPRLPRHLWRSGQVYFRAPTYRTT